MNTNFKDEYRKWIEKLSKQNFDELILNYAKEYYETRNVFISDGPYDGGIDLIYSINDKQIKRNIQITVQQNKYENKLEEDLKKSKENIDEYNYLNTLDFYISQPISPEKKKKLIKNADINYQITLRIIDANELAGLAQEFKSIRQTIHKFNKAVFPEERLSIDTNTKILFDTLSMGRDITSIKNNFIQSLILTHLYTRPNETVECIYNSLSSIFYNKFERNFFETEIGKLKSESKIIDIPGTSPKQFKLTDDTKNKIEEIENNSQTHEAELIFSFKEVLGRFNLVDETESIVKLIIELYNANYELDENELLNGVTKHSNKIQKIFENLINHLTSKHGINVNDANSIARQLLIVCSKNEFLNKISVSKMFTNLFKSDKLESYLNSSKRKVYLDTQILLQTICFNYDDIEYDDRLYQAVKSFLEIVESSDIPICLHTTIGYVEEVAWHILNGVKLARFLELDFIKDLGPSKNVFFNYFLELRENHIGDFESFADFVEELLDVNAKIQNETRFIEELIQNLVERFELLNIVVETPPLFDNYDAYRRQYEISLSYLRHDQKSYEARKHDLNTILHLSQLHFDMEDGYFTEPYLITWDTSFYEVRSSFNRFKELSHWYVYPPMKFANTVSVMNMRIDSNAINYNIISLAEENFNLSNDAISFLDIINGLFTDKDVKKWKLVNKLAKMRKNLLHESNIEDFSKTRNNSLPIDEFLLLVQRHYQNPINRKKYRDIVCLFQNNDYADKIANLIETNLGNFQIKNEIKPSIITKLDELIKENNEAPNSPSSPLR
ncbi:MAG: hypothetical protein JXP36_07310 [Bacteroidales bacterium]|nr:hypothetical protein [Bacteroidales bacterium]